MCSPYDLWDQRLKDIYPNSQHATLEEIITLNKLHKEQSECNSKQSKNKFRKYHQFVISDV